MLRDAFAIEQGTASRADSSSFWTMIQSPFVFFRGAACDEKSIVVDSMPLKTEPHRQPLLIDKVSNGGQRPITKRIDLNFGSKNRRKHKFHAWNLVKPLYHSRARALLPRE